MIIVLDRITVALIIFHRLHYSRQHFHRHLHQFGHHHCKSLKINAKHRSQFTLSYSNRDFFFHSLAFSFTLCSTFSLVLGSWNDLLWRLFLTSQPSVYRSFWANPSLNSSILSRSKKSPKKIDSSRWLQTFSLSFSAGFCLSRSTHFRFSFNPSFEFVDWFAHTKSTRASSVSCTHSFSSRSHTHTHFPCSLFADADRSPIHFIATYQYSATILCFFMCIAILCLARFVC